MDNPKRVNLLKDKIKQIDTLVENEDREVLRQWREETLIILDVLIDQESKYYKNFEKIRFSSGVVSMVNEQFNRQRHYEAYLKGLQEAKASLNAILFGLEQNLF